MEISWKVGFGHPIDGIEDFGSIGPIVRLFVHLVLIGQTPQIPGNVLCDPLDFVSIRSCWAPHMIVV